MDECCFDEWVFRSLVKFGAIKDYSVSPKASKGRAPSGNLSVQIANIANLRKSEDPNMRLWGLIASAGLQGTGEFGKRMMSEVERFSTEVDPKASGRIIKAMKKAAKVARIEFDKRYVQQG